MVPVISSLLDMDKSVECALINFVALSTSDKFYSIQLRYFLPNDVHGNWAGDAFVADAFLRQFKMDFYLNN
jgi:hypothetical protein